MRLFRTPTVPSVIHKNFTSAGSATGSDSRYPHQRQLPSFPNPNRPVHPKSSRDRALGYLAILPALGLIAIAVVAVRRRKQRHTIRDATPTSSIVSPFQQDLSVTSFAPTPPSFHFPSPNLSPIASLSPSLSSLSGEISPKKILSFSSDSSPPSPDLPPPPRRSQRSNFGIPAVRYTPS